MTARNDITGDLIKTKFNTKQYQDNLGKIFGDKPTEKGKFKQCRETGKLIPMREWQAKYGSAPKPQAPMFIMSHFEPYQSPVTGEVIENKREAQYDLDKSGCRIYEGRESEQKEADRHNKYQEEKFEQEVSETIDQTSHEIEHGYREVSDDSEGINFTFGED